jgi:hypothetical protein
MSIIIDSCTISAVFDSKCTIHHEFEPVLRWITDGDGIMVMGGTKYMDEIKKLSKYYRIILELQKANRAIEIKKETVDEKQEQIDTQYSKHKFNDSHLIALIITSGSKLLCTSDYESIPFIQNPRLYPSPKCRPKIYTGKRNIRLLTPKNIRLYPCWHH